jgi:hypothetical protein
MENGMSYTKVTDPNILAQLNKTSSNKVINTDLLKKLNSEEKEQFLPPKKEGISSWLPRDILIGLSNLGHKTLNEPYEMAKNISEQGKNFGIHINQTLPMEKFIGENRLPNNKLYLQQIAESFNKKNKVPEELQNKKYGFNLENIPHQQETNFAELLGQTGTPSTGSKLIQKGIEYAPELAAIGSLLRQIPITSQGIVSRISAHKQAELTNARNQYQNLFNQAEEQGITQVLPPESAVNNRQRITANSQSKYNRSLNEYIQNPTLQNAHYAQSELGSLERHLNKIADKNGLTPTQYRTLRDTQQTRNDIRQQMLSDQALGRNSELAENYQNLTNQYRENVVPYTRLEPVTEVENERLLAKNAIKELLNDDQFMIELANRYPGLRLHTPGSKKIIKTGLGLGATVGGWEGLKKLFK